MTALNDHGVPVLSPEFDQKPKAPECMGHSFQGYSTCIVEPLTPPSAVLEPSVGGEAGPAEEKKAPAFHWLAELGAGKNYRRLGKKLAATNTNLYRNGSEGLGLVQVLSSGVTRAIRKGPELAPLLVDTLSMRVVKGGKPKGDLPPANHLNALLRSEKFLWNFRGLDVVSKTPMYREDLGLIEPGYHDFGPGQRVLFVGDAPAIAAAMTTVEKFLNVMNFAESADRTNTVAAALTGLTRNLWRGEKPVILVTATKSHSGKGTITDFFCGSVAKAEVLYESVDWPMQSQFQRQLRLDRNIGVLCIDNVRQDSAGGRASFIRSAFIESLVTNPEIVLSAPGAGDIIRIPNGIVVTINTNDGTFSPDLLNRALPIHLAPKGDVGDRHSPIGNPKLEFLPQYRDQIEAELRGMIERWRQAGSPPDQAVKHPMSRWAETIGGILRFNGFTDFLANYSQQRVANDPIRQGLAILASERPGKAMRPLQWAKLAVKEGLAKTLFSAGERDTEAGRERAIGKLLSRHLESTFEVTTETERLHVRLTGGSRRWVKGSNPHVQYVFQVESKEALAGTEGDE